MVASSTMYSAQTEDRPLIYIVIVMAVNLIDIMRTPSPAQPHQSRTQPPLPGPYNRDESPGTIDDGGGTPCRRDPLVF
jgi:hypothetical protein